jgi:hypothetical protein
MIIEAMGGTFSGDDVQSLLRCVREFILHPRRLDPLVKDPPNWNMAASAMDVISDTEWAITSYEGGHFSDKRPPLLRSIRAAPSHLRFSRTAVKTSYERSKEMSCTR